jgi:hypothetical protein
LWEARREPVFAFSVQHSTFSALRFPLPSACHCLLPFVFFSLPSAVCLLPATAYCPLPFVFFPLPFALCLLLVNWLTDQLINFPAILLQSVAAFSKNANNQ